MQVHALDGQAGDGIDGDLMAPILQVVNQTQREAFLSSHHPEMSNTEGDFHRSDVS
jgi:hypothetical protein